MVCFRERVDAALICFYLVQVAQLIGAVVTGSPRSSLGVVGRSFFTGAEACSFFRLWRAGPVLLHRRFARRVRQSSCLRMTSATVTTLHLTYSAALGLLCLLCEGA